MDDSDALLSDLCSICHINPPKYRCPRCSTRTCSLPCTKRHKLWSQCSGVRDPAAYLRRNELATESAFDRDFNFITGIERSLERADRDAENRGIDLTRDIANEEEDEDESHGTGSLSRKRKHPQQGLVKGEAGFLRGAESGEVNVIRAPRGMTRNEQNGSRWHPKHKCLSWTVEWILATGEKNLHNCLENCSIAEAYDRAFPLPKHERVEQGDQAKDTKDQADEKETHEDATTAEDSTGDKALPPTEADTAEPPMAQPAEPSNTLSAEAPENAEAVKEKSPDPPLGPHRELYFYLHRPRTTTKKPVLVPLPPSQTLVTALRKRTVLEFPTIYILPESREALLAQKDDSQFILEEDFLPTAEPEGASKSADAEESDDDSGSSGSSANLEGVDEKKVLEVLKQDLFEPES